MAKLSIKTIGMSMTVKLNGPEQYEGRTFEFSAYADLNARELENGKRVLDGIDAENKEELAAATNELLEYVRSTVKEMSAPYLDYRARMRRSALEEVRRALPRDLQHLVGSETVEEV